MSQYLKDPDSVLPYGFDWANGGANDGSATDTGFLQGDTISTSAWTVSGPDSALVVDSDSKTTTTTTAVISAGTVNKDYTLTNRIVTTGGYTEDRSLVIKVRQR